MMSEQRRKRRESEAAYVTHFHGPFYSEDNDITVASMHSLLWPHGAHHRAETRLAY